MLKKWYCRSVSVLLTLSPQLIGTHTPLNTQSLLPHRAGTLRGGQWRCHHHQHHHRCTTTFQPHAFSTRSSLVMCSQSGVHRLVIVEVVVAVVVVFPKWRKGHLRRKMKQKSKSVWAQKWASGQWKCCLPACWCHCSLGNNNSADSCSSGRRRQRNQNVLPCQSSYHRSFVCKSPSISSSSNQKLVVDARLIDNIDAMRQRHMGKPGQRLRQRWRRRWCVWTTLCLLSFMIDSICVCECVRWGTNRESID